MVGIVFTDTPDGGFDFDFLMFEGKHSEQTPAILVATAIIESINETGDLACPPVSH